MIYRIYTEDKNRETIKAIMAEHFDGYSLIPCDGVWKGTSEPGLIVEVLTDHKGANGIMNRLARKIKAANQQESVLVAAVKGYYHAV